MQDPTAKVQSTLDAMDLDIEVKHFDVPTGTAPEAALAVGCELGAIVKSGIVSKPRNRTFTI